MKIAWKYQFLIPILVMKYQFLKVTKNCSLTWMFEASVSTDRKKLFQFLAELVKNLFHWLIFFNFTNISYFHLLKRPQKTTRQWQIQDLESFDSKNADKIENNKEVTFIAALVYPLQHSWKLLQYLSSYTIHHILCCSICSITLTAIVYLSIQAVYLSILNLPLSPWTN